MVRADVWQDVGGALGYERERIAAAKSRGMQTMYALAFAGALVMSYVLAHLIVFSTSYFAAGGVEAGLTAGFWTWLGFIAPVTLGTVLWEGKPWKLWMLNNAYQLISLLVIGVTLAVWQ